MKGLCIILLSIAVLYAAGAAALASCSFEGEHELTDFRPASEELATVVSRRPAIHCLHFDFNLGPMIESSKVRLRRPDERRTFLSNHRRFSYLDCACGLYALGAPPYRPTSISLATMDPLVIYLNVLQS